MNARTWPLGPLFSPQSIAMVGANEHAFAAGAGGVYANLKRDFPGRLYPVSARRPMVQGDPTFDDVESLPEPVDLLIVMVQADVVHPLLERAAKAGHRSALVLSSGFSEVGVEGAAMQAQLSELAQQHGMPILGPNCVGFMNGAEQVMANFSLRVDADRPRPGSVAVVSQSGGFGSYILSRSMGAGLGIGYFASTGNEAVITVADVLAHLVEQPEIRVLTLFSETIRDPGRFLAVADRARELDKVIVSVTPATTEAVARAAMSHTGSIIGSRDAYDAVCRQRGILRADSIDEMVDYAAILQDGKRMRGRRLGIVTTSGGAGVLMSGTAADHGLEVPVLAPAGQEQIAAVIPAFGSPKNPVDTTAGFSAGHPEVYEEVFRVVLDDDAIDAVVPLTWYADGPEIDILTKLHASSPKPIAPVVTVGPETAVDRLPVYSDPSRAVRAVAAVASVSERPPLRRRSNEVDAARVERARALLAPAMGRPFALESTAKEILALYGVPTAAEHVATDADEAVEAAARLGGAVVLKVLSYDLPHKSDAGGVVLDLRGPAAVRDAFTALQQAMAGRAVGIEGILVQQMARGSLELAVGMHRDPVFGPMVAVGLGGRLIELTADAVLVPAPFERDEADAAVRRVAGGRITHATRGLSDEGVDALAACMVGVGRLAVELPEIDGIDVNPLLSTGDGALVAVDALFTIEPTPANAPQPV